MTCRWSCVVSEFLPLLNVSVAMVAAELGGWKKNLWRSLKMLECSGHVSDGGSYVL